MKMLNLLLILFCGLPAVVSADDIPRDGLLLWLSAANVEMKDGSVEQVTDLSGKGNHAKREHDARQVLATPVVAKSEGAPVLRFDGRYSSFTFPEITSIRTVVWVLSKDAKAFKQKQELFVLGAAKSLDFHPGTHFTDTILHQTPQYGAPSLQQGKAWLNGRAVDARATDFPQKLSIICLESTANVRADQLAKDRQFQNRCWQGDIAEILLFDRALSDAERQSIEQTLAQKHGVTLGH